MNELRIICAIIQRIGMRLTFFQACPFISIVHSSPLILLHIVCACVLWTNSQNHKSMFLCPLDTKNTPSTFHSELSQITTHSMCKMSCADRHIKTTSSLLCA